MATPAPAPDAAAASLRTRRSPRLTYVLRPGEPSAPDGVARCHSAPVNALACSQGDGGKWLFTGSRDGGIRAWRVAPLQPQPVCASVGEGHADWVTSVAVCCPDASPQADTDAASAAAVTSSASSSVLVSGSFDATVALWRPVTDAADRASRRAAGSGAGTAPAAAAAAAAVAVVSPLATLASGHTDFVTCVASAPGCAVCASAGLGGQLCLWDIATAGDGAAPLQRIPDVGTRARVLGAVAAASSGDVDPGRWSIYALAMCPGSSPASPLVAWGDACGSIRLWDTRQPPPACWGDAPLQGHTATVRCLLLDGSSGRCVSAGADATLRLWDLRTARQLARLDVDAGDSVWALASLDGARWRTLVTGHRSGDVAVVTLGAPSPGDVDEPGGVTRLARTRRTVIATCDAPVTCVAPAGVGAQDCVWVSTASAGPHAVSLLSTAAATSSSSSSPPTSRRRLASLPGAPGGGLRRAELCADRRHAVAQDCDGTVRLWDLVAGCQVKDLGPHADWEAARCAAAPHTPPAGLPAWCSVDVRLGGVGVHVDPASAFAMEAYATDLGVDNAPDDQRLNMGHQALCCVLARWAEHAVAAEQQQQQQQQQQGPASTPVVPSPPREPPRSAFAWPRPPPVLLFQGPDGTRLRRDASRLALHDGGLMPGWATEAVLYDPPPTAEPPKISFFLLPGVVPGTSAPQLPALAQNRLTAPRILKAAKIRKYLAAKLELPVAASPDDGGGATATATAPGAPVAWPPPPGGADGGVRLCCDGKVLDDDVTLAQAQAFLWKQPGELTLEYSRA